MSKEKLPPRPGFTRPEFWFSFLTVICTFILGQLGISSKWLQSLPGEDNWLPIVVAAAIGLYILISTFIKTRLARVARNLPVAGEIEIKTHQLIQTSEFWLGLTTVTIKFLQESKVAGESINSSVTTTFLVLAIVYALSRAQLKQAYMKSLLLKVTDPKQTLVAFSPERE